MPVPRHWFPGLTPSVDSPLGASYCWNRGNPAPAEWASLGSLSNDDGDDNENGKKVKQQRCTCITLFCTFLCRQCTTTVWKCLISRFVENVNTRQRLYSILEFNSRKNWQYLTSWTRSNKRDKVWSSVNSPFDWRFRSRNYRCCLNSVMIQSAPGLTLSLPFHCYLVFTSSPNHLGSRSPKVYSS